MYVIRLSLKKFSLRKVHHLTSFVIARPSLFYMCLGFLSASALLAANNISYLNLPESAFSILLYAGYNVTVLAYGQTGSGKTHSMGTAYK